MHELSLAQSVVRIVEESARSNGFSRVKTVRLEIGRLAGVEIEAMRFCFDVAVRDSVAEGAELAIIETEGRGWCLDCSRPVPVAARYDACPQCGGYAVELTAGTEMRVKELEVE